MDAVVTEAGLAINPRRMDLRDRLQSAGIPMVTIEELKAIAERRVGRAPAAPTGERTVAVLEYRDGTVIDVVGECSA